MSAIAALVFCLSLQPSQDPKLPNTVKECVQKMSKLCSKPSLDWHSVFTGGGATINTRYTERFLALTVDPKNPNVLTYKVRDTRDANSESSSKKYEWNDKGTVVYQVDLKDLDESKITPSKVLQFRAKDEPSSAYAYVFVLCNDKAVKVKVSFEDAHDSFKVDGAVQTGEDSGTYSHPPRDRPSLVLNTASVEDAQQVASLLKRAIELAKSP